MSDRYENDGYEDIHIQDTPEPDSPDDPRKKKGLSNKTKGIITLVLVGAYLLVPVDAIPDALVGLGQIDDAIVFATGVISILMRLRGPKK